MFVKISESVVINVMNVAWIDISDAEEGTRIVHMVDGTEHAVDKAHVEDINSAMKRINQTVDRLALGNF